MELLRILIVTKILLQKEALNMILGELHDLVSENKTSISAEEISKIIKLRKAITEDVWKKNFDFFEYRNQNIWMQDLKKKYFEVLKKYLESNLIYKNKKDLIVFFDQLPEADLVKTFGEQNVGDFIDEQLKKTTLDVENLEILLSPELNYKRIFNSSYEAIPILQNLISSNRVELISGVLDKYPVLNSQEVWTSIYYNNAGGFDPNFKKIMQVVAADIQNNLKAKYNSILSTVFDQGLTKVFTSYNSQGELSEKQHETLQECVSLLRLVLNKGAQLDEKTNPWLSLFVKWEQLYQELPEPTVTDSGYKDFYNLLMALRKNHLLAHRMDILGESNIQGVNLQLHGSFPHIMIPEAQKSFSTFLESHLDDIVQDRISEFAKIDPNMVKKAILETQRDLSGILMTDKENEITARLANNTPTHIPVTVRSKNGNHQIAVSLGEDLCLICDRAREEKSGIEIYKMDATEENKSDTIKKLGKTVPQRNISSHLPRASEISKDLTNSLNMTPLDYIPRSEQYGENCTWNSSAKMIIFSGLYLRFYQVAQNNNMGQEEAMAFAKENANAIYKKWSKFDKTHFLRNYLDTYLLDENNKYGPDSVLLSMIFLRNEHKAKSQKITEMLKASGYINEKTLKKAQEQIYKMAEFLLNDSLPSNFAHDNPELMDKIIKSLTEFFMRTDKSAVNQVFSAVEEKIKSDQLDEIPALLDDALAKLQSNKIERNASPVFHQYREQSKASSPGTLKKQELEETSRKSLGPK